MKKNGAIFAVLFLVLAVTVVSCGHQYWSNYSIVGTWYYEETGSNQDSTYVGFNVQYGNKVSIANKTDKPNIKPVFDWKKVENAAWWRYSDTRIRVDRPGIPTTYFERFGTEWKYIAGEKALVLKKY